MKVFCTNVPAIVNEVQNFAKANCIPNLIQFLEDARGNLFITAAVLFSDPFSSYKDQIVNKVVDNSELIDFVPRQIALDGIDTNPVKFKKTFVDGLIFYSI